MPTLLQAGLSFSFFQSTTNMSRVLLSLSRAMAGTQPATR